MKPAKKQFTFLNLKKTVEFAQTSLKLTWVASDTSFMQLATG